jgi:hypothetical protein
MLGAQQHANAVASLFSDVITCSCRRARRNLRRVTLPSAKQPNWAKFG